MFRDLKNFAVIALLLVVGCTDSRHRLAGVYSNELGEFSASSIALSREGFCLFAIAVGGLCGSWEEVSGSDCDFVHLRLVDMTRHSEVREYSALLRIEPKDRTLQLVSITNTLDAALSSYAKHGATALANREGKYRFVTNAIPDEISAILARFPENLEHAKMRAETFHRRKEEGTAR